MAAWDPSKHPRLPKGHGDPSGEFISSIDIRKAPPYGGSNRRKLSEVAAVFDRGGPLEYEEKPGMSKVEKNKVKKNLEDAEAMMTEEVGYQISQERTGLDWYTSNVEQAFAETSKHFPELAHDPEAQMMFTTIAGITSSSQDPDENWSTAAKIYGYMKSNNEILGINPENGQLWPGGPSSAAKKTHLEMLNSMYQDMGLSGTVKWLLQEHSMQSLAMARENAWGKYSSTKNFTKQDAGIQKAGFMIFGEKMGPFISNIHGVEIGESAIDRWATRTFNRYFRRVADSSGKIIDAPTDRQRPLAKGMFTKVASKYGLIPKQGQSVMWAFEQQLYNHMGAGSTDKSFVDGARMFDKWVEAGGQKP